MSLTPDQMRLRWQANRDLQKRLQYRVAPIAAGLRPLALRWSDFPKMRSFAGAHTVRMASLWGRITAGRINFEAALRAYARLHFPGWVLIKDKNGSQLEHRVTGDARIAIRFERDHMVGKQYTVSLRLLRDELQPWHEPAIPLANFFDLFSSAGMHWTYGTRDDLDRTFSEVGRLVQLVLPGFERACHEVLAGDPDPAEPVWGPLSFLEAVAVAARALGQFPDQNGDILAAAISHDAAEAPSGRLQNGGAWRIRLGSVARGRAVDVHVPFTGPIVFQRMLSVRYRDPDRPETNAYGTSNGEPDPNESLMLPIGMADPAAFMEMTMPQTAGMRDSPDVLARAERELGRRFRDRYPDCTVGLGFGNELPVSADWNVVYRANDGNRGVTAGIVIPAHGAPRSRLWGDPRFL